MFKGKIKIWIFIICICAVASLISKAVPKIKEWWKEKSDLSSYTFELKDESPQTKNRITGSIISVNDKRYKILINSKNPDVIISREKLTLNGYNEFENYLYIPYILIANPNLNSDQEFFTKTSHNHFTKDIRYILRAIEEDKTWEEIGFSNNYVIGLKSEPVSLTIPNRYDDSYTLIKKYFMLALNDYEISNNYDSELEKRVDLILEKCKKVENVSSLFDKDDYFKEILFYKESIVSERIKSFKESLINSSYVIISPEKTIKQNYNVYIKTEKKEEIISILESYQFLELTGFRNRNSNNVKKSDYYENSFEIFDFVNIEAIKIQNSIPVSAKITETITLTEETTEETIVESEGESTPSDASDISDDELANANDKNLAELLCYIIIGAIILFFLSAIIAFMLH